MRRTLALGAACLSMLLVGSVGIAQAQDDPPVPPAFVPPAPAPVVDEASAEAFIDGYASDAAERFLGTRRSRVRVLNVESSCLQHPVTLTRYGCVVRLRALVIQKRNHWRNWSHSSKARSSSKRGHHGHRVRIRAYGCLGIARIDAIDPLDPQVRVPLADCQRIQREDIETPEPV